MKFGLNFFATTEHVGQHQTAFGVGVDDLDGLAGHRRHDIAWALRVAVGRFSDDADGSDHIDLRLPRSHACISPTTQAARHVALHVLHAGSALMEMPPVSKQTPLPIKATG